MTAQSVKLSQVDVTAILTDEPEGNRDTAIAILTDEPDGNTDTAIAIVTDKPEKKRDTAFAIITDELEGNTDTAVLADESEGNRDTAILADEPERNTDTAILADEPKGNKQKAILADEPKGITNKSRKAKDGGWGWVVVAAAFTINVITDGCLYSFGVLFVHLVEYFDANRSETAWIGSVLYSTPLLCGPVASALNSKTGYRKATIIGALIAATGFCLSYFVNSLTALCLTYGVVAGFGISVPYLNAVVAVADYFETKLSLANGISQSGAGIGTLIFAPLLEHLIVEYGWRGAVLIVGGIVGNVVVCGALMKPLDSCQARKENGDNVNEESTEKDQYSPLLSVLRNRKDDTDCSVLALSSSCPSNINGTVTNYSKDTKMCLVQYKSCPDITAEQDCDSFKKTKKSTILSRLAFMSNRTFIVFGFTNILLLFWYDVPYVFTVDRSTMHGISDRDAALLVSLIGICHTGGNLLYGYVGDKHCVNRTYLYCISLISWGVVLVLIPCFVSYIPSAILLGLFGVLSASSEVYGSVILVDILGVDTLNDAYGVLMFLQGVANLIGPPFAGWLYDVSGSYRNTYTSAGVSIIMSGTIFLAVPLFKTLKTKCISGSGVEMTGVI